MEKGREWIGVVEAVGWVREVVIMAGFGFHLCRYTFRYGGCMRIECYPFPWLTADRERNRMDDESQEVTAVEGSRSVDVGRRIPNADGGRKQERSTR